MPIGVAIPIRESGLSENRLQFPFATEWHAVIVHRLLERGPSGFNELKENVDGISSKVLSDSLDDLEANGLVTREVISEKPFPSRTRGDRTGTAA